jgi:replicative DNA helicase
MIEKTRQISFQTAKPAHIYDIGLKFLDYIDNREVNGRVFRTGFNTIDNHIGGFMPGDVVIVGGRTGRGKSALCVNMACNMAADNLSVFFFSLEMTSFNILGRIIGRKAGINTKHFRLVNKLTDDDITKTTNAVGDLKGQKFYLEDRHITTLMNLENYLRKVSPDVVFVDFVQRLTIGRGGSDNRASELDVIANKLKTIAKQKNCCIVAAAQLDRGEEGAYEAKRPTLKNIKWSAAIAEAADMVFLLTTKQRTAEEMMREDLGSMMVYLEKNRHGDCFEVELDFKMETQKLSDKGVKITRGVFGE